MSNHLRLKSALLFVVLVVSSAFSVFPFVSPRFGITRPQWLLDKRLKLGLDLKGGRRAPRPFKAGPRRTEPVGDSAAS